MVNDYGLYFTPAAGQLFDAEDGSAEYGSKAIDQEAARDVGVATPIAAFYKVVDENSDIATSLTFEIVGDDDGAGTNEVVLATLTVLKANLTVAKGVQRIGFLARGNAKRYLRAKVTSTGAKATKGKIAVWIDPSSDGQPANGTFSI